MKPKLTQEEFQKIEEQSRIAEMILNNPEFEFIRSYLYTAKESAEKTILHDTICDVTECVTITDSTKKEFLIPKQDQLKKLIGKYEFIEQLLADLQYFANMKVELNKAIDNKEVIIEGMENGKDKTNA